MKALRSANICAKCALKDLRSSNFLPVPFLSRRWQSTTSEITSRKWSTPLAERLAKAIATTGPISLASYMRECLTAPEDGYYTKRNAEGTDPFGVSGDFVTAPEISQVFGELVGLWTLTEWLAQGQQKRGVHLIELGPGRGTLMSDLLRATERFTPFFGAVETVFMMESSPSLRDKQRQLLCGDTPFTETKDGWECHTKHSRPIKVVWLEDLKFLPKFEEGDSPFFMAHEFFDALPIHAFQSSARNQSTGSSKSGLNTNLSYQSDPKILQLQTSPQSKLKTKSESYEWRELMVTISPPRPISQPKSSEDFQLSKILSPTPHSTYLPSLSSRYTSLLSGPDATIEISPESLSITDSIAKHIGSRKKPLGAALIMDYGPRETIPANTLRGIRAHELVSPFSSPGMTDLSASVDFVGLAHAALQGSDGVEVFGPASQSHFLNEMGVEARGQALEKAATSEDARKRIRESWKRLIDKSPRGMGVLYNVLAIVPRGRAQTGGVVGFGGQLGGDSVKPLV